jgi:bifunctional DNase/RNase
MSIYTYDYRTADSSKKHKRETANPKNHKCAVFSIGSEIYRLRISIEPVVLLLAFFDGLYVHILTDPGRAPEAPSDWVFIAPTPPDGMDAYIEGVRVADSPSGVVAVVTLGVEGGDDVLPIFVGFEEATSIARGLDATDIGRPLTHDLLLDVMEELGSRIERVVVTAIEEGTYIADLHLETPRNEVVVDARPSDSLALAARTNTDIEISEAVFEAGREPKGKYAELDDIRGLIEA